MLWAESFRDKEITTLRYSWTADCVLEDKLHWTPEPQLADLIPLETKRNSTALANHKRLVIGHNVGFDRSFVKEQYLVQVGAE